MRTAAVEHVAPAVAAVVCGDALLVAEAEHLHHERCFRFVPFRCGLQGAGRIVEARQAHHAAQHIVETGIVVGHAVEQQAAQAADGQGYAVQEILLPLHVAPESVGTQHLERAEEHEEGQPLAEAFLVQRGEELVELVEILPHEVFAQRLGVAGRCLPEEGGHVVLQRTLHASLEIDEARPALRQQHHVARLAVAVEEEMFLCSIARQVGREALQVGLELQLVEGEVGSFEKTVFEIVEVEHGRLGIEAHGGQTLAVVEAFRPSYLDVREQAQGAGEQCGFGFAVVVVVLPGRGEGIVERDAPEVFLQVAGLVVVDGQNARHGESLRGKVACQVDETVVFAHGSADNANDRFSAAPVQAHVAAVAPRFGKGFGLERCRAAPFFI